MFEKFKEHAHEAQVAKDMAVWNDQVAELQSLLALAEGTGTVESAALMLKASERLLGQVSQVGLVGQVRGPGHYQGASQGISIPIGSMGGRSVRYRVGATRGHYVQGQLTPAAIDHGTMSITSERIVFQGAAHTAEAAYAKLIGIEHGTGEITISVSNRQHPTVLAFGAALDDWVADRLNLALAIFNGHADQARAQLQSQLDELAKSRPA